MTSDTHGVAEALRTLHRIHQQLNDLKGRLARGPRLLQAHAAAVARLEAEADAVKNDHKTLRIAMDQKQLLLSSNEAAVKRRRLQLTQASDNREYQALRDQIAADEMANSVLADEILEGMEKLDELAAKVAAAEKALAKGRADAEKAKAEIAHGEPLIRGDIKRLQEEMKHVEEGVPSEFKDFYDRLVRNRGADALSLVDGRFCSGCNRQIPLNRINALMLGRPITCQACGRLLYLPEGYEP
ncbi:MAG: phospholipase [Pirellulaceae bacterium]|jgi:predicted  nucleic acid-binding Zn-ribbon protein|nr:phospholipase [Thermoguttaceae bacterium]MDI9446208.1 phospholipase [Planctomycetota bacterium]NLY98907.1 phospholipase [Pirellulaceae bacterium]